MAITLRSHYNTSDEGKKTNGKLCGTGKTPTAAYRKFSKQNKKPYRFPDTITVKSEMLDSIIYDE